MQSSFQARKATRQKAKIRLHLSAPSGGGKTYSAILIAQGLVDGDNSKIGVIDTENRSADLYAHLGEFNVVPFDAPYSPERYIEAIEYCEAQGYEVIIIDSITHEWDGDGGILRIADRMTGDNFAKWKALTPRHDAFIQKILTSRCHIITTVRRKQEYALVDGDNGKKKVEKLGLKEVTREGIDYEMTTVLELDINHNATATKDRTGLFMDKPQFTPGPNTGRMIAEWCENGQDVGEQVREAIAKLATCDSRDEVQLLGETLPAIVSSNPEFRAAATDRWAALKVPAPETVQQPVGGPPQQELHPGSQDLGPFKTVYETTDEVAAVLEKAGTLKEIGELYYTNQELVELEANADLKIRFKTRRQEIESGKKTSQEKPAGMGGIKPLEGASQAGADAAAANAIAAAQTRAALLAIYKEHKALIDTHDGLKTAYDARLDTFPKPGPKPKDQQKVEEPAGNPVEEIGPTQQTEGWFKERIGKHIWMQGKDDTQFSGPHLIEHAEVPGWLLGWQEQNGFTYRDLTDDEQASAAASTTQGEDSATTETGTSTTGAEGQGNSTTSQAETAGAEALEADG